jgi:formylglycine-generating enzyme required for sulfatase activity
MNAELPEMTTIAAGDFAMGSDDGEPDERPVHLVELDAFAIGVQPVSNL